MSKYIQKELSKSSGIETKLVRAGTIRSNFGETSEAIFMNSGYAYNSAEIAESRFNGEEKGYVYSRYLNPNLDMLKERLVSIEAGAEDACITASGMAAVFACIMCQVKAGDHVIANKVLFGSCFYIIQEILPQYGIEITLIDECDEDSWQKAFRENTSLVFIESPANPTLSILDIKMIANLCQINKATLVVDNVFSTPLGQSPLLLGADQVVYSTTKHIDGGGKTMGGAIVGKSDFIEEVLLPFYRHTGPTLSPFNCWVILKSLETFKLRYDRHVENGLKIAEYLETHSKIERVLYPGLKSHPQYDIAQKQMKDGGAMIAFYIKGDKATTFDFMNRLKIVDISNNLGDSKSLITHPMTTTHSNLSDEERLSMDIKENLVRLSVGIETIDDLLGDIAQALGD